MNARSAPETVRQAHLTDQPTNFGGHLRSARPSPSRLPAPEGTKTSAMPAEKRLRPNNCHRIENARRDPVEQHQDEAIQHLEGRALGVPRRSTFNCWRRAITSASSEILDRKRSRSVHLSSFKKSNTRRSSPDSDPYAKRIEFAVGTGSARHSWPDQGLCQEKQVALVDPLGYWAIVDVEQIKSERLFEAISRQIGEQIHSGRLKPGEKLPNERELAARFAVSRHALREALRSLESIGQLEFRKGATGGAFVASGNPQPLAKIMQGMVDAGGVRIEHLTEARLAIETAVIALACHIADEADFRALSSERRRGGARNPRRQFKSKKPAQH